MMNFLGISGQVIPALLVPFETDEDGLVIEGFRTKGQLVYSREWGGWFLITEDKSKFLSTPHQNFKIVGERLA